MDSVKIEYTPPELVVLERNEVIYGASCGDAVSQASGSTCDVANEIPS